MYLLRLALRPWRLAPFSQVFSCFAVGFLLLLAGFLFWMQSGLKPVLARLQGEQVITAYIDPSIEAKDDGAVLDQIRTSLGAAPIAPQGASTTEIKLVDRKQFLANIKGQYPDLSRELEDLGGEMDAIIPRYVSISGMLDQGAIDKVRAVRGVESAETSKDRYQHVVGAFQALRWVARLLTVGLCLALLTGLVHLSRMNSYLHRDAVSLLRLWGAGEWTIRLPGIISGSLVGIAGGWVAFIGWMGAGAWLARHVRALSPMLRDMPMTGASLALTLMFLGAMIGLLAGTAGTLGAPPASAGRS